MATIRLKRGSATPAYTSLVQGEPAVDTAGNKFFIRTGIADSSADVKWMGAEIENAPGDWTSQTKLATQSAINNRFAKLSGDTFTGNVIFQNDISLSVSSNFTIAAGCGLRFNETTLGSGNNYVQLLAPSSIASNFTLYLPSDDGSPGQALITDGSGNLSFAPINATEVTTSAPKNPTGTHYLTFVESGDNELHIDTTTNNGLSYTPSIGRLSVEGDLNVNGGDITSANTVASLFATTVKTLSIGTASTEINLGSGETKNQTINICTGSTESGSTKNINIGTSGAAGSTTNIIMGTSSGSSDISLYAENINSMKATVNIFDTNTTTANMLGSATTSNIGWDGTGTVSSTTNIAPGVNTGATTKTVNIATDSQGGAQINIGTSASNINSNVSLGGSGGSSTVTVNKDLVVTGDLTVNGTTVTVNTTTLDVEDKNISLGINLTTDLGANNGGITLYGATNKTFQWKDATDAWTSSEHMDLATGKSYYINGTSVLSSNTLGSGVTTSSLTTVGALSSGSITSTFTVDIGSLNIDGAGDTTTIAGADLLIVDDGANGNNRKVTVDNLFGSSSTAIIDGGNY